ncbi:alpha/beta fold hydrolase [Actinoplanes sp. NPDC051343]|uniref:alpha/beta fold hydrolase n=1 Tax=Actinoplanes sp. NPDC051343 TaxID=3363906 RepID=UPI0037924626
MTDLAALVDGPLDAPPLLLIHGTAASSESWSLLLPYLTPAHRVIRVDLPGRGRSPADGSLDVAGQASAIGATAGPPRRLLRGGGRPLLRSPPSWRPR